MAGSVISDASPVAATVPELQVVQPANNTNVTSVVTLAAKLADKPANAYHMFWYVDNGAWNWMGDAGNGKDTKQTSINVSAWNWHAPSNVYKIDFVAVMLNGGQRSYGSTTITIGTGTTQPAPASAPATTVSPTPVAVAAPATATVTTSTSSFYVNPSNNAARTAAAATNETTKRVMTKLAAQPSAFWFGGWNSNVGQDVAAVVSAAKTGGSMPVLVAYNIPQRDCGSYSAGGAETTGKYREWIQSFASGIGTGNAIIILEPDALAQIDCLSAADKAVRNNLLSYAVTILKSHAGAKVYLDAGNPDWIGAGDMATRLNGANIAAADGFSLNVSNFQTTPANITYGKQISAQAAGKHFVIDTSRNGNGHNGEWCNPSGRALGAAPTNATGESLVDYLLWIKTPGESDGSCNGAPTAGAWWPAYAEGLAVSAGW